MREEHGAGAGRAGLGRDRGAAASRARRHRLARPLARPLTVVTLGLSPTRKVAVSTTVSALLMDTRTGYIYSTYESTKRADTLATSWGTRDAADTARRDNERVAFRQMVDEMEKTWPRLLDRHARKG